MRATLAILGLSGLTGQALERLPEHLDIRPTWVDGEWSWAIRTDSEDKETDLVFLPARDRSSPSGELFERPSGSQWDILGLDGGESVWILPQSDTGYTWPGMENAQSGLFGSYVETDPRVGGIAQAWIRIELASVDGPGAFTLFQIQGGLPVVWMASADGVAADDVFFLASPGHDHMNWAFSAKGVYRIRLRASAFFGPGATNPTPLSDEVDLFFSVGARADWRASHFSSGEVMDEMLAGDGADPERDGDENLLEYAFGTDPHSASPLNLESGEHAEPELLMVEDGGMTYPALRFFQRIHADSDISYQVEWSDRLSGGWNSAGTAYEVEDFGEDWERVTIRDNQTANGSRFGRVRVTVDE